MTKHEEASAAVTPSFSKEQFLASEKYTAAQKDVLAAVLQDGEAYTLDQANKLAESFLRKEAK